MIRDPRAGRLSYPKVLGGGYPLLSILRWVGDVGVEATRFEVQGLVYISSMAGVYCILQRELISHVEGDSHGRHKSNQPFVDNALYHAYRRLCVPLSQSPVPQSRPWLIYPESHGQFTDGPWAFERRWSPSCLLW